jgi:ATP-binding cassette subfamily B protein
LSNAFAELEKLIELMALQPTVRDDPNATDLKATECDIEFKGVSFGYADDKPIVQHLSFQIPAGKTVALVGPSGSGKTTVSRLLCRFYDPTEGRILINGQASYHGEHCLTRDYIGDSIATL